MNSQASGEIAAGNPAAIHYSISRTRLVTASRNAGDISSLMPLPRT